MYTKEYEKNGDKDMWNTETIERIEGLAQNLGLDPKDARFQEGIFLAKHIEKCRYCSMLWNAANEVTSSHAREDAT